MSAAVARAAPPQPAAPAARLIHAAHDRQIATLAASDDGSVAVSVDDRGGMRLWPSLDGTREPVVVANEAVIAHLAIARDGDAVVIAAAGPLGQLAVIRTSGRGELLARTPVDLTRPIVALRATASGFVALRDDQVVVAVDLHGVARGQLAAKPGERIAALTGRRGKLLALVQRERRVRARWLEVGDKLAWGSESPPLAIDPTTAVLAPDLQRIAATSADHKAIEILDLAQGRRLARPLVDDADPARRPLGFLDDDHLQAQVSHGASKWLYKGAWSPKRLHIETGTVVATDRAVLATDVGALSLSTPTAVQQLGYRMTVIAAAQLDGDHVTLAVSDLALQVDDRLETSRQFTTPENGYDITLLDGRHAVLRIGDDIFSLDLAHPEKRAVLVANNNGSPHYEPATHLLALAGGELWLGHYDAKTHRFDKTTRTPGPQSIVLLDPAANHGNVALIAEQDDNLKITEIRGVDFAAKDPLRRGHSYHTASIPGDGMGPPPDPLPVLGLSDPAKQHARGDGAMIAEVAHGQITLRDRSGAVQWSVARPGTSDVLWLPSGELVAFGSGMAKIDVATGALLDRQCGWQFGLVEDTGQHPGGLQVGAALCEAP